MKRNHNAECMRDFARQLVAVQRPNNEEFWRKPECGRAEHALNELLTDLVTGKVNLTDGYLPIAG